MNWIVQSELGSNSLLQADPRNLSVVVRHIKGVHFRVLGRLDLIGENGSLSSTLELGNLSGTATATLTHNGCLERLKSVSHGSIVKVYGDLVKQGNHYSIVLDKVMNPGGERESLISLLPKYWVLHNLLPSLRYVMSSWDRIENTDIRIFLNRVFSDPAIAMGFLNIQASQRHHHSYQGGLLVHTADMLHRYELLRGTKQATIDVDLTKALILIHDLGKTVTMVGNRQSDRGCFQPHEFAALEIIAEPLMLLERSDSNLANQIRGFFKPKDWYPRNRSKIYQLVSNLDRLSASEG